MCDAREHAAGYVLETEEYTDTAERHHNLYAPLAFRWRRFTMGMGQTSLNHFAKEILVVQIAFPELGRIMWGVMKHTIVMIDTKTLFCFFFHF